MWLAIRSSRSAPIEHPLSKGYSCPKGRALGGAHLQPDAITRPMMRKDGVLAPAAWDECLNNAAARLRKVMDEHGPQAIAINFGSGLGMDASGYRGLDDQSAVHRNHEVLQSCGGAARARRRLRPLRAGSAGSASSTIYCCR